MSNLVGITELTPDVHPDSDNVTEGDWPILWDMELPPDVDAERVAVDMGQLRRIHAVADVAASFVEGYEGSESDEVSTGTCTDPFDSYLHGRVNLNATFGRPAVAHQVNEPELTRIADERAETSDKSRDQIWAELYDEAMRSSMTKAARQSLIGRQEKVPYSLELTSYWLTAMGLLGLAGGLTGAIPGADAVFGIATYTAGQAAPQLIRKSRTKGNEVLTRRVSLVPMNRQPDRYALTWALCKKSGLVRLAP